MSTTGSDRADRSDRGGSEVGAGYRRLFRAHLVEIDARVMRLFTLVTEAVAAATSALLRCDAAAAHLAAEQDRVVDQLERDLEGLAQRELAQQAPMAGDLRYLLSVIRVVPELERSGDLAEHIARRALGGLCSRLPADVCGVLERMGSTASEMWQAATTAWAERDPEAAERLDAVDDRLDALHDELIAALLEGDLELDDALQTTLVGRFFERLGDHAVHISERICYLAGDIGGRTSAHQSDD
jgi:phosphate transport system protein